MTYAPTTPKYKPRGGSPKTREPREKTGGLSQIEKEKEARREQRELIDSETTLFEVSLMGVPRIVRPVARPVYRFTDYAGWTEAKKRIRKFAGHVDDILIDLDETIDFWSARYQESEDGYGKAKENRISLRGEYAEATSLIAACKRELGNLQAEKKRVQEDQLKIDAKDENLEEWNRLENEKQKSGAEVEGLREDIRKTNVDLGEVKKELIIAHQGYKTFEGQKNGYLKIQRALENQRSQQELLRNRLNDYLNDKSGTLDIAAGMQKSKAIFLKGKEIVKAAAAKTKHDWKHINSIIDNSGELESLGIENIFEDIPGAEEYDQSFMDETVEEILEDVDENVDGQDTV
ncbi:MAG: hypothetical protein KAT43_03940 [Nanoarchaeota archaeon]|nr:hypothetical protein [Nanoarchaeota archaeon]